MLGWCLGALISTMYSALRPDDGLKNLILLTAPLDFEDKEAGGFIRWSSNPAFNADTIVEKLGNVPGEMIDNGAKMLKPIENYFGSYTMLWDNIEKPGTVEAWHAMNTWVRDIIPMAGGAYKQLINEFYKENKLDGRHDEVAWRIGGLEETKSQSAERDCRIRPHHAALPVRSDHGPGRQRGQGVDACSRRTHRHHGRTRCRDEHLATHRIVAGCAIGLGTMTPNWDFLLDEASLASILPGEYARFARPIRDATEPLSRRSAGVAAGVDAGGASQLARRQHRSQQRLGILARSSPVLQKLGQILARDRRLPLELRQYLRELESLSPSVPAEIIRETLTQELGSTRATRDHAAAGDCRGQCGCRRSVSTGQSIWWR